MDLDYFLSFHTVFVELSNIIIEQNNNNVTICYLDKYQITYSITNIQLIIEFKCSDIIELNHLVRLAKIKFKNHNPVYLFEENIIYININSYDAPEATEAPEAPEAIEYFLTNLHKILESNTNLCTCCTVNLNIKGMGIINCCDNIECKREYFNLVTDNRVVTTYNKDPKVFEFLLNILIQGISHPKGELAFKPLPLVPNISNLAVLKEVLTNKFTDINIQLIFKYLNSCSNDIELFGLTDKLSYCILKNAVSDNYFSMSSRAHISGNKKKVKKINPYDSTEEIIDEYETNIMFLNINYSAEIENKFPQKYYLFHGSSMYSWYPIVKNGLKIMSGTALQANGAVYGSGIYFSDSFEMSLGYSSRGFTSSKSFPYNVVSVFEILQDTLQYKKSPGIFVISDDSILVLRYFVLVKNGTKLPKDITKTFTFEIPAQKQLNKTSVIMVKSKRLNAEYKNLSSLIYIKEVNIIDEFSWIVIFCEIKSKIIKIELKFSNYPLYPPDIKIIEPKQIGSIADSQQNIKIPLTNPNTWEITNNLSQICLFLYNCFTESI
jgi:hypothetical protein